MLSSELLPILRELSPCTETSEGVRVTTHCVYPSFEPVTVFVARLGEGFCVHDGGGGERAAWIHGRNRHLISKMLSRSADRYGIRELDSVLIANAANIDWLPAAILSVANASAAAANAAVEESTRTAQRDLDDRVSEILLRAVKPSSISRHFPFTGQSGKKHHFSFVIKEHDHLLLLETVVPHHVSIAAKYVAFADTRFESHEGIERFAVYERKLEASDASLLHQVADLVPLVALDPGVKRVVGNWRDHSPAISQVPTH